MRRLRRPWVHRQRARAYLDAVETEADISPTNGLGLQHLVHGLLVNRLRYHADLNANPEIADEDVSDPIVVAGLFRTGTTKLQRMMSTDPGVQDLTFWRLLNVAPLPGAVPGEPDPRIAVARNYVDALASQSPEFMAAHAWIADEPDEDSLLLWLTFNHLAGGSVGYIPSFVKRVQARDQHPSYEYLAGILRYMQWQDGGRLGRPWVLKSPTHVGSVEPILAAFPNATIAFCHREPTVVVPSFVRLFEIFWGLFGNSVDPRKVGPVMLDLWSQEMVKGLEQRRRLGDDPRIVDVYYDDIVANPLEVIRSIYDQHGRILTSEAEKAFIGWEQDNPQHKFGKHQYTLESCGLTEEQVHTAFAPYAERFRSDPSERNCLMSDLKGRVERLETERDLTRLVYDYCHGIDRHDLERFLSVWDENATWDTGGPFGSYTGLADIERGLKESMWPVFSALHHWTVNLVLDVDDRADVATGMSNLTFQGSAPDGTAIVVAATYHDKFSRRSGRWGISRRSIEIHHFAPLPGVVFTPIPVG